jgi:hypothetical protein
MVRRVVVLMVAVLVVAGCGAWGQAGFDGGASSDNRADTALTAANVGGLHEVARVPGRAVVIGGGHAFTALDDPAPAARHALVAYDEQDCTGSGVPACSEAWSRSGLYSQPVTDGTSVFVVDRAANVVRVFGVDGTPLWTYTPAPVSGATTKLGTTLRLDDGRVWAQAMDTAAGNVRTDRLVALPAIGCGAATCNGVTTIGGDPTDNFLAGDGVVFADRAERLHTYDAADGTELWRTSEPLAIDPNGSFGVPVSLRDNVGYVYWRCQTGGTCSEIQGYELHKSFPCTESPCVRNDSVSRIRYGAQGMIATQPQLVTVDTGGALSWWTCATTCHETALYPTAGAAADTGFAKAGDLIFVAARNTRTGPVLIRAVANAPDQCPDGVTVRVCSAVWTSNPTAGVHGLVVTGGRVYAAENDGMVHVYAR